MANWQKLSILEQKHGFFVKWYVFFRKSMERICYFLREKQWFWEVYILTSGNWIFCFCDFDKSLFFSTNTKVAIGVEYSSMNFLLVQFSFFIENGYYRSFKKPNFPIDEVFKDSIKIEVIWQFWVGLAISCKKKNNSCKIGYENRQDRAPLTLPIREGL